ncbi:MULTISPECIES: helix-turn-helix domain-containing protein [Amycolatopsis]|uniref:Helix-turn-helix domain-containing protein n=1 Tax=Amycolatopsis albidoflavus TaxID=102226 RepID=A0ABW5I6N5_9PSEU
MPTVKPALRAARRAKGLKISHLAARIDGLKVQHLANCESGHAVMSIELANLVARELGVEVGDIVDLDAEAGDETQPEKTHPTRRQEQEKTTGPKRASEPIPA